MSHVPNPRIDRLRDRANTSRTIGLSAPARRTVVNNVAASNAVWVLFNLGERGELTPPVVIPSTTLTRKQWLNIFAVVRSHIRDSLGTKIEPSPKPSALRNIGDRRESASSPPSSGSQPSANREDVRVQDPEDGVEVLAAGNPQDQEEGRGQAEREVSS